MVVSSGFRCKFILFALFTNLILTKLLHEQRNSLNGKKKKNVELTCKSNEGDAQRWKKPKLSIGHWHKQTIGMYVRMCKECYFKKSKETDEKWISSVVIS